MEKRIKEIRKKFKLSQEEFAQQLGVDRSYLSLLETGKAKLKQRWINLICKLFNVSESWLRTGEGEMFVPPDSLSETDREKAERYLIEQIRSLPQSAQTAILVFCRRLLEEADQENSKKNSISELEEIPSDSEIARKVG